MDSNTSRINHRARLISALGLLAAISPIWAEGATVLTPTAADAAAEAAKNTAVAAAKKATATADAAKKADAAANDAKKAADDANEAASTAVAVAAAAKAVATAVIAKQAADDANAASGSSRAASSAAKAVETADEAKQAADAAYAAVEATAVATTATASATAAAAATPAPTTPGDGKGDAPTIPASDDSKFVGDHLRLRTNVHKFHDVNDNSAPPKDYCAPVATRLDVGSETTDQVTVRVLKMLDDTATGDDKIALEACKSGHESLVNTYTSYTLAKTELAENEYTRTGVSFGGLVVPFKYRLGKSKELVSSSAVAPYFGFRTGWGQSLGLTVTPVVAAGLSLVPVTDSTNKTTATKAAYTAAVGFRVTSSKNDTFSAGLLFGRDFLNKADRDTDPTVKKPWASFYLGYAPSN